MQGNLELKDNIRFRSDYPDTNVDISANDCNYSRRSIGGIYESACNIESLFWKIAQTESFT